MNDSVCGRKHDLAFLKVGWEVIRCFLKGELVVDQEDVILVSPHELGDGLHAEVDPVVEVPHPDDRVELVTGTALNLASK